MLETIWGGSKGQVGSPDSDLRESLLKVVGRPGKGLVQC
jgi:hypothetical protein